MFSRFQRVAFRPFAFNVVTAIALCSISAAITVAQGVGANRGLRSSAAGIHTIKGRVFFPENTPAGTRVRVRLEGTNTFGGPSSSTDEDGNFMFTGLESGPYVLVVEGDKMFETARESVAIDRESSPGGRIVDVPVYLKLKPTANPAFASVPKPALDLYVKAQESIRAGDGKKAIEQLKGAIAGYANFSAAYNDLGVEYLKTGDVNGAAEALANAVKLTPTDFHARLNFGIALLNQKKFVEAEEHLTTALTKNPNSALAHMYLGMALMNQKKLEAAQKELEKAVASNSAEVGIAHKYLGGIYWGNRDYKRAADELEMYLKLVPKAADAERTKAAIKDLRSKQ